MLVKTIRRGYTPAGSPGRGGGARRGRRRRPHILHDILYNFIQYYKPAGVLGAAGELDEVAAGVDGGVVGPEGPVHHQLTVQHQRLRCNINLQLLLLIIIIIIINYRRWCKRPRLPRACRPAPAPAMQRNGYTIWL